MSATRRPIYIDGFQIDITVKETHTFSSETTEHPVEKGADITDHIRSLPVEISMDCVVSDTPIGDVATDITRRGRFGLDGEDQSLPSDAVYAHLLKVHDDKRLVIVETSLGTFKDMVLTNLSVPREAASTGGLTFSATFKNILLVENKRFTVRTAIPGGQGGAARTGKIATNIKVQDELLWCKGVPPGAPLVQGYRSEYVTVGFLQDSFTQDGHKMTTAGGGPRFFHQDSTPLTEDEQSALAKDLNRDAANRVTAVAENGNRQSAAADRRAGQNYLKQLGNDPTTPNNRNPQGIGSQGLSRSGTQGLGSQATRAGR